VNIVCSNWERIESGECWGEALRLWAAGDLAATGKELKERLLAGKA